MRHHLPVRRGPARPDADQQRTVEPAAILVRAFEIHVRGPASGIVAREHREMRGAGIEPHIQNVGFLAPLRRAAGALRSRRQQFLGGMRVPGVRAFALEKRQHVAQRREILQLLAARVAIKNDQRHAPEALPRNAPVRPLGDHVVNALVVPTPASISLWRFPPARAGAAAALSARESWACPHRAE